jgi:hypothetical protein
LSELPTALNVLILQSNLLPMSEAKGCLQSDGLAALLVTTLPLDAKKLWL